MHAEEQAQLEQLVALVRAVLGPDLLGAYLHGSAVLGGLRERSDLDLLVVSRRGTTREEKHCLVERLLHLSGRGDPSGRSRPVELTLVVEHEIRPWRHPARFDFQYGDWLRPAFERGDVEPWPTRTDPDLASLLTMVLLADEPLLGPPPAALLDPVPRADYVDAIVAGVDGLLEDLDGDTRNVVLTLARIWSTLATDTIRSKDAAADWVLARLPEEQRAVLARARAVYLGEHDERWDDLAPRVRPHVEHVVHEIARLAEAARLRTGTICA